MGSISRSFAPLSQITAVARFSTDLSARRGDVPPTPCCIWLNANATSPSKVRGLVKFVAHILGEQQIICLRHYNKPNMAMSTISYPTRSSAEHR